MKMSQKVVVNHSEAQERVKEPGVGAAKRGGQIA
jgi:hypothetical protein